MLESQLLRSVEKELKRRGIVYRKRWGGGPGGVAGDPDLYFCVRGHHCEVELKRPGEEATRLQQLRLEEWSRAGASTSVIHTLEELRNFLSKLYT